MGLWQLGILLVLFGVPAALVGAGDLRREARRPRRVRTTGLVVDYVPRRDRRRRPGGGWYEADVFHPVVRFALPAGEVAHVEGRHGLISPTIPVGQTIPVAYRPGAPEEAEFAGSGPSASGCLPLLAGGLLLGAGALVLLLALAVDHA